MTNHVTAAGFEADGVRLIPLSAGEFDALIETLAAPGWAPTLRQSAPSIVIVANETSRTIVAFSTRFSITCGPHRGANTVFFVAPDAIAATGLDYGRASSPGILPGERKMIGFGFEVPDRTYYSKFTQEDSDFYDPQVRDWIRATASELESAHSVHVTLDAVIFDDGRLLGDPTCSLVPHFDALVRARQNTYSAVLQSLDAGERVDNVVNRLWSDDEPADEELSTEWYAKNEARNIVAMLRHNYGEDALADVLPRALLRQPFIIRKP